MLWIVRRRHVIAVIALLLHAALVTSCSSWQTRVKPVRAVIETGKHEHGGGRKPLASVRIQRRGEEPVIVYEPRIIGDSLLGTTRQVARISMSADWRGTSAVRRVSMEQPAGIPLDSIRSVEVRAFSLKKTVLHWGIGLGLMIALLAATGLGKYDSNTF